MRRNLAVFDIDGTLTDTNALDASCFTRAMSEASQLTTVSSDWTDYTDCTDEIIFIEAFEQGHGRPPSDNDRARFIDTFLDLFTRRYREVPSLFRPIPGATDLIARLSDADDWSVALATGSWHASALLKLRFCGVPAEGLPIATADDAIRRTEIVTTAIERVGGDAFDHVVLIGDGPWDVDTASALGYPFVGVGTGREEERLRARGAVHVLRDYVNVDEAVNALGSARAPTKPGGESDRPPR